MNIISEIFFHCGKAGFFEGSFFLGGCQFNPHPLLTIQEELIQYQYNLIHLLNN